MKLFLVLVLSVFLTATSFAAKRTKNYHLQSFNIECDFSKSWFTGGKCNLTRFANGTASLTAMGFVTRPADGLFCRVQSYVMNDNKKYTPGLLASTIDVCAISEGKENFWVERFFPRVIGLLKDVIRPCPYEGALELKDFRVDGSMLTKFLPAGAFRLDGRIYNARNDTLFYVRSYAVIQK